MPTAIRRQIQRRRYHRALVRARRVVPYYRERAAATGRLDAEPVPDTALAESFLFHRLGRPPPADPPPGDLYEALLLTGRFSRGTPVFALRPAWREQQRLGRRGRCHTVLDATAEVDPYAAVDLRTLSVRRCAGTTPRAVVGDAKQLAWLHNQLPLSPPEVFEHGGPASHGGEGSPPDLLYVPGLGYLGARAHSCGRLHLNGRRFHPRVLDGVLTVTRLIPANPVLVHIKVDGLAEFRVDDCDQHPDPVLTAPARSGRAAAHTVSSE